MIARSWPFARVDKPLRLFQRERIDFALRLAQVLDEDIGSSGISLRRFAIEKIVRKRAIIMLIRRGPIGWPLSPFRLIISPRKRLMSPSSISPIGFCAIGAGKSSALMSRRNRRRSPA